MLSERELTKRLSDFAKDNWERLEGQRALETGNRLREYGYQFKAQPGRRSMEIAGIPFFGTSYSFGILWRPVAPTRPAEAIIREIQDKYYERFLDRLGEEMARLGWIAAREGLRRLGKMFFISPEMQFD